MKLDMHCHTKEGSLDSKIDLFTYVHHLSNLGYDGMLITDHNSYRGYEFWEKQKHLFPLSRPFHVFKGIEYDTGDAGHFIVILPDYVNLPLLRFRGLPVAQLIRIVHLHGGILGPAHPYGNGPLSFIHSKSSVKNFKILKKCDFIEGFNACENPLSNYLAARLAKRLRKPSIAGSDAHRISVIGSSYTIFDKTASSNNELIRMIKEGAPAIVPPYTLHGMYKRWNHGFQTILNLGFQIYHRILSIIVWPVRTWKLRHFRHL